MNEYLKKYLLPHSKYSENKQANWTVKIKCKY